MKAIACKNAGSMNREDALQDITLEKPVAEGRDLRKVHARIESGSSRGKIVLEGF